MIDQGHLLPSASLPWKRVSFGLAIVLLLAGFDPYREGSETEPVFYRVDAFYIPFAGYDAVVRGGPIVKI